MHVPINVKSLNNISKWQMWFNSAFKVLTRVRLRSKCDGTRAETRFRLSQQRTSPFKSAGASVQSTTGNRGVRISGSNVGYTMFRGSVRVMATHSIRQFPFHFPSRASPCAITFQLESITEYYSVLVKDIVRLFSPMPVSCLPYSFLQSNVILIHSTTYPGSFYLSISEIFGCGQDPFQV
jgi:hypothetical protein